MASRGTCVGIVGAGPAGLLLGNLLVASGVECVVLERYSREHIENRARAGLLTHATVELLDRHGLADRLRAEAARHTACEFRYGGERFSIPYDALSGGRGHYVYPQQFVVRDLLEALLGRGGTVLFETECTGISRLNGPGPALLDISRDGRTERLDCDHVAGCDGQYGASRAVLPPGEVTTCQTHYGSDWLAVLAQTPPATEEIIYGVHDDGFAGHMLRTPEISRFYLQCAAGDHAGNWPDERVWEQLNHRLALHDEDWKITPGPLIEKRVMRLQTRVTAPMRYGKLSLAGDAAHVVSPAGGKGMNMALADAADLAASLIGSVRDHDRRLLDGYSQRRLPRVWRSVEFSHWMLRLLQAPTPTAADAGFLRHVRLTRLRHLRDSPAGAATFADGYATS